MRWFVLILVLCLAVPVAANAAFPGNDRTESPRDNTPNDPEFDRCENDNEEGPPTCGTYAEEEFRAFGFSPDSANELPGAGPHYATGTKYKDCSQLDAQGRAANVKAENAEGNPAAAALAECLQIAGIRADTAWKYWTGDAETAVAILDTGIRWQSTELVNKVRLNREELPLPAGATEYDANDDGAFNVKDYAADPEVEENAGDDEADGILDASDLIATFSDNQDDDSNGYVDDIAGWDFFDDDNDPYDASSCCSASGHGTGRAAEAAAETNNGPAPNGGGVGMCPECQIMPLRVWDTFVVPTDNFAMATVYAADNGADVVEGAVGGLTNTQFARSAFRYADLRGLTLTMVSSDINSANHNYPTNYNEAIYVAGSIYDTAPSNTCSGLPSPPVVPEPPEPPEEYEEGCQEFLNLLGDELDIVSQSSGQPITTSFFRNSNLTQYGGKADIVLMGSTGSENTGQASGAAALLMSYGREKPQPLVPPLNGNEVRQLLTMTAEDVLPANTGQIGLPDRAEAGWDTHFGYGRVNLAGAMERIRTNRIPPQAQIDSPDWFAPINVDRVPAGGVPIRGRALARGGVDKWEIHIACGQDATDAELDESEPLLSGTGAVQPGGQFGTIPPAEIAELADPEQCNGEVQDDPGRPAGTADDEWPADPYPDPDPERHAFQIRLTVHAAGDPTNIGRYRKTLHAYEDDGNLPGWPQPIGSGSDASLYRTGSGGEASPRLFDVDGDNKLDVITATSSGELWVRNADGTPVASFNGGEPVRTDRYELEKNHPLPITGAAQPRESLRVPAIGDIDGDLEPEIVATAGEHLYAWEMNGDRAFVTGVLPELSEPCKPGFTKPCFTPSQRAITSDNHIKRGFIGSPVLADLLPERPGLEIVAGALDQHVYAWKGDGTLISPAFPKKIATEGADGAEIVTTPAIADLDGEGPPEIVISTNEVATGDPEFPDSIFEFLGAALEASTGYNPVYALHADGTEVEGWPVKVGVAAGDLLPLVLPGHDAAVINADGGTDEVAVSAGTSVVPGGGARLVGAGGESDTISTFESAAGNRRDEGAVLNLADYTSAGDILGTGAPQILKGGLTVNGAANLLAVNQNLPFNHVEQLWAPATPAGYVDPGPSAPGFPLATDDFQLVSQGAVARVGESTTPGGRQALVGTGLYQLHAYGPDGEEPEGWPKFTGGWTQATAAVGDADGNGKLDVASLTREGWAFLWETDVDACSDSNNEWWTYHHDEHSTANYGHDARPPGTPRDVTATRTGDSVTLTFKAPGDDWLCGTAAKYRVTLDGQQSGDDRDAAATGESQTVTLDTTATTATIRYRDESGNWGHAATVTIPVEPDETDETDTGPPRPGGNPPGSPGPGPGPGPGVDTPPAVTPTPNANPAATKPCRDVRRGTRRNDVLFGTAHDDRLLGLGGRDRLFARGDADCLAGGWGNDLLRGGGGRDTLHGGPGRDRLSGDGGIDVLRGGRGRDRLLARGSLRDVVDCGPGRDVAIVDAGDIVRRCERVRRR